MRAPYLFLATILSAVPAASAAPAEKPAAAEKPAPAAKPASDGWTPVDWVIAIVNEDVVLKSDLERRLASFKEALDAIADPADRTRRRIEVTRQVVSVLIDERILAQEAKRMGLTASDEEVDRAIAEVKAQNKLDDAGLAKALATNGYSMPQYREEIRRQVLHAKAVNLVLRPRIQVAEAQVKAAYKEAQKRDPKGIGTFAEVKEPLQQRLFEDAMTREQARWLGELRADAYIGLRTEQ